MFNIPISLTEEKNLFILGIILEYFVKLFALQEKMQISMYNSSEILHPNLNLDGFCSV